MGKLKPSCWAGQSEDQEYFDLMNDRIELNPEVCGGRAVVRGTRITVETILGYLSAGDSTNEVLEAHPNLTKEDVLACLGFAQRVGAARSLSLAAA
jgi:uncharacterized protein (DUF433 family)